MTATIITEWKSPVSLTGDAAILDHPKTAFFCSQQYPAKIVLPSLDWAEQARDSGACIISGFQSLLEENVRDILLLGEQPLIWVIGRKPYAKPPAWAATALQKNRLLIISTSTVPRPDSTTANQRNRFIAAVADNIVVGHATPGGNVARTLQNTDKPLQYVAQ